MNCRPGDIAIVVQPYRGAGLLFDVLEAAPELAFLMPDGYRHIGVPHGRWLVRCIGLPVKAIAVDGSTRYAMYGVLPDYKLRPLRGTDIKDETTEKELTA